MQISARRTRRVARRDGGADEEVGGVAEGMWWPDGKRRGGQDKANLMGWGECRIGICGGRTGWRVSEREGRRGRQGRVSEQRGRVKLAAWIMCTCGMLDPLVLHPVPHQWSRLC
jgi:hypothetical protein